MTNIGVLRTFRAWVQKLSLMQELGLLGGVVLFFLGMSAESALWKLVFLGLAASAIAYVIVSFRSGRSLDITEQEDEPTTTDEEDDQPMAKIIFDDVNNPGSFEPDEDASPEPERDPASVLAPPQMKEPAAAQSQTQERTPPPPREYEFKLSDFFEKEEARSDDGPKAEFRYLLKKILTVIKEVHFAHTVALFWINRDKQQIVLEGHVTDSESFTENRRREVGSDLVSQVGVNGEPKLMTNVNALSVMDLLPYYDAAEEIKTFVGVPIFYSSGQDEPTDPVAVLAIDCMDEDAYGPETLAQLGQFTKLITATIQSYTDKYDLLLDSEVLRSITRLRDRLRVEFDIHNAVRALVDEASRVVPWDYISVVIYDEVRKTWALHTVMNRMNDPYVPAGQEIDVQHSLCGETIQYGTPKVVDIVEEMPLPRFYTAERCESRGSLVVTPLTSFKRCYGALLIESKDKKTYSEADQMLLQKLADTSSWALEILGLTDVATNFVSTDEVTGVSTHKHFLDRVQEETQRAADFDSELAMVMIAIDTIEEVHEKYGAESVDTVLRTLGRMIRSFVRPYDVVGRFDANRFAVLLAETSVNKASLWAEKLRKNVASHILNVDGKSFSVTISVGVSGAGTDLTDMILLENADRVLKKAVEAGGNIVRVF